MVGWWNDGTILGLGSLWAFWAILAPWVTDVILGHLGVSGFGYRAARAEVAEKIEQPMCTWRDLANNSSMAFTFNESLKMIYHLLRDFQALLHKVMIRICKK